MAEFKYQRKAVKRSRTLYSYVLRITRWVALLCLVYSIVSLLGYVVHLDVLYRPISGGPATNPITALCFLMLSFGYWRYLPKNRHIVRLLAIAVTVITLSRLIEYAFYIDIFGYFHLFNYFLKFDKALAAGAPNVMGLNTALNLLFLSLSLLLVTLHRPILSQILGSLSLCFPFLSVTGYIYNITDFYGQMSLVTTVLGVALGGVSIGITANRGIVRAILSPHIGGKLARIQFLTGYIVCFGLGVVAVRSVLEPNLAKTFGLYVIIICWFVVSLISISALIQENVDRKRRASERRLISVANTDQLTGLLNRHAFFHEVTIELMRQKRIGYDTSILLVDIDFFKKINDTYGHAVGDDVLALIAQVIKKSLRQTDIICRYGGEEFALILPDTSLANSKTVADKILNNVRSSDLSAISSNLLQRVTVSIGCSNIITNENEPIEDAIERADMALYRAKYQGRDQAVLCD